MHIAIVYHKEDACNNYGNYLQHLLFNNSVNNFTRLYLSQFLQKKQNFEGNLCIIIEAGATTQIGLQIWTNIQLPFLLKKIKADIVIHLNGFLCNRLKLPQLLVIPSTGYFENKTHAKSIWQKFSRKNINKFIPKASAVITYSQNALQTAEKYLGSPIIYSHIIQYTASNEFKTLLWPDKVLIKGSYTNNKEFFVAVINSDEDDFTELLKAFSVFKKWQQSSMQFLFLSGKDLTIEKFNKKLAAYKYRSDVRLLPDCTDKQFAFIIASAYCLVYNNRDENLLPLAQAVKTAVPVIAYRSPGAEEYAGSVVLFSESNTYESLGNQMIFLYKNENLKEKLSVISHDLSAVYKQEDEAENFWDIIQTALK